MAAVASYMTFADKSFELTDDLATSYKGFPVDRPGNVIRTAPGILTFMLHVAHAEHLRFQVELGPDPNSGEATPVTIVAKFDLSGKHFATIQELLGGTPFPSPLGNYLAFRREAGAGAGPGTLRLSDVVLWYLVTV
jgi:hypothetical protein